MQSLEMQNWETYFLLAQSLPSIVLQSPKHNNNPTWISSSWKTAITIQLNYHRDSSVKDKGQYKQKKHDLSSAYKIMTKHATKLSLATQG